MNHPEAIEALSELVKLCKLAGIGRPGEVGFRQMQNAAAVLDKASASLDEPYRFPYWCRTCGNSFSTEASLVEHRQRKHAHIVPVYPLWTTPHILKKAGVQ